MHDALSVSGLGLNYNQVALDYYRAVIEAMRDGSLLPVVDIFHVSHAYSNYVPIIQAFKEVGNLVGVVVKNSTALHNQEVTSYFSGQFEPLLMKLSKKDAVENPRAIVNAINERRTSSATPFIIADHGGYFAFSDILFRTFRSDIYLGSAEYTANGEERYRRINGINRPVISIGRSDIKTPSDAASAELLVHGAITELMKVESNLHHMGNRIGVIGYGKLGRVIAQTIASRNFHNVMVTDDNPIKLIDAKGLFTATKEEICKHCNILFCATGNHALEDEHYAALPDKTVIFTVTSPDDELDLDGLIERGVLTKGKEEHGFQGYLVNHSKKTIYLPHNGESPTTAFPGSADTSFYLPHAGHMAACLSLIATPKRFRKAVIALEETEERLVCSLYNKHVQQRCRPRLFIPNR